jgi:hypothetical protein
MRAGKSQHQSAIAAAKFKDAARGARKPQPRDGARQDADRPHCPMHALQVAPRAHRPRILCVHAIQQFGHHAAD